MYLFNMILLNIYGFTFKDSVGYGLYPITESGIKKSIEQLKPTPEVGKPVSGDLTSVAPLEKWKESGFKVNKDTNFIVLEAESEEKIGNGITTCTLKQKGNNYIQVEEDKKKCTVSGVKTCDETPGTLAGDGTKKSPYMIESIEDLVAFSNIVNNKQYKTGFYSIMTYEGRTVNYNFYIELTNNLDFKSRTSYINPDTTDFGDVNNDGKIESLIIELNSGAGFPIIDSKADENFKMFFDGKNHYLKNYNYNIVNTDASKPIIVSLFGEYDGSFSSTNITNLELRDVNFNIDTTGNANISPLIQEISWYDSNQLSDITINGKIKVKCGGTCNVGGLANSILTYGNDARNAVSGINIDLDIDVEGNNAVVGGVTSKASNYGYYILDSSFKGDINVKATNQAEVGGITGSALYFKSVNTSVISDINVETKSGEVYGIGEGTIYNSFYKGNIYVKSYTPINMASLGSKNIYNSYAIGNMIADAEHRNQWPKIAGLSTGGSVYNSYYIGNLDYNTITSYGGGGPTVLGSLLTIEKSATNSFVRGKITNSQNTTWSTYFGLLSAYESDENSEITGIKTENVKYPNTIKGTTTEPLDPNYNFIGWISNTDVILKNKDTIKKGEIIKESQLKQIVATNNMTLTAQYKKEMYSIFYKYEEGIYLISNQKEKVADGEKIKGPEYERFEQTKTVVFICEKDVKLISGETIKAGEEIKQEQLKEIIVSEDLIFTLKYTEKLNLEILGFKITPITIVGLLGFIIIIGLIINKIIDKIK